ncbi:MAG: GAF domain-containing protein [Chloroflexi bacterium]|nr:GAF domain-containing protein [Chloroflexota bacterium]
MPNADPELLADPERLNVLRTLFPARGATEPAFDRLASLAARLVKAPIGIVTLVDIDRMTFVGAHGLTDRWPGRAIWGLSHSYCPHVIATREPLVIDDARKSALVRDCDAVRNPGFTAYLGVPLTTVDGFTLAALAVADRRPRRWSEEDLRVVSDIAECAVTEIHLRAAIYADSGEEPVLDTAPLIERTTDIRALDANGATRALLYQRLAQIAEPLIATLTSTSDIVWVADSNGDLLYLNPRRGRVFRRGSARVSRCSQLRQLPRS